MLSNPKEAELSLDGKTLANGGTVTLSPGSYELTATVDDFDDIEQQIEVRVGPPLELDLKMVPGYSGEQLSSRTQRIVWGSIFAGLAIVAGSLFAWQGMEAEGALTTLRDFPPLNQGLTADQVTAREAALEYGKTSSLVADSMLATGSTFAAISAALFVSLVF